MSCISAAKSPSNKPAPAPVFPLLLPLLPLLLPVLPLFPLVSADFTRNFFPEVGLLLAKLSESPNFLCFTANLCLNLK